MRRALAKPHLRVAAVDDGAFTRRRRRAPVAAVAWSAPDRVEAVAVGSATVDGTDATRVIADLVRSLRPFEGIRAVLLDGVTIAGFNVVDLDALSRRLGRPVVALTRRPPDFPAIRAALVKWFPDGAARYARLRRRRLFPVATGGRPIYAAVAGASRAEAVALVHRATRVGFWPEPLRLAHLVARAVGTSPPPRAGRTVKPRPSVRHSGL